MPKEKDLMNVYRMQFEMNPEPNSEKIKAVAYNKNAKILLVATEKFDTMYLGVPHNVWVAVNTTDSIDDFVKDNEADPIYPAVPCEFCLNQEFFRLIARKSKKVENFT